MMNTEPNLNKCNYYKDYYREAFEDYNEESN